MTKRWLLVPIGALALAGCQDKIDEHAERTGNAIAADVEAATDNMQRSVDAFTNTLSDHVDRVTADSLDRASNRIDVESGRLQDDIERHTDRAADQTGAALERAGRDLRDRDDGADRR